MQEPQLMYECTHLHLIPYSPGISFPLSSPRDDFESSHFNFFKHSKLLLPQINEDSLNPRLHLIQFVYPSFSSRSRWQAAP